MVANGRHIGDNRNYHITCTWIGRRKCDMTQTNSMKEFWMIVKSGNGKHETHTKVLVSSDIAESLRKRSKVTDVSSVEFVSSKSSDRRCDIDPALERLCERLEKLHSDMM